MLELTRKNVELGAVVSSKAEAIQQVGNLLVDGGYIAPDYVQSMLGREKQANTYLGNGIAIPHGMLQDRELIKRTGIAVVQVPDGIEWNPGDRAHLIVGIAASSDEHLSVLANLTDVLDDAAIAQQLAQTTNPDDIIYQLTRSRDGSTPPTPAEEWPDAPFIDIRITNSAGLHARPATVFLDIARGFESEIQVRHGDKTANGKALASLLKLGVEGGQMIRIAARGPDADAALQALVEAIEHGLEDEPEPTPDTETFAWTPVSAGRALAGVAASPGIAIGPLYQYRTAHLVVRDNPSDVASEKQCLQQSLATASEQLTDIYASVKERSGSGEAAIFRAHQALLEDPDLIQQVEGLIVAGHSAAWSWQQAIEERVADLQKIHDERLAARAVDFHDVGQRVLRLMVEVEAEDAAVPGDPVILVAEDLLPSDTARLNPKLTLGLCTASGGPTSHTAIIARSLGIPAIVGVGPALLEQPVGTVCILDGGGGMLYIEPTEADFESAQQSQTELERLRDEEYRTRYQPALTTDGHRIEVVANIGKPSEAVLAVDAGAEGIGLMRTEFLFLDRATPPSEEEQYQAFRTMIEALNGLPLIIRTLDIGGDKALPYLGLPAEENPFLGVRGIRLCLRKPELFRPQLRAIYRASQLGPVKIMFPMIATLEELHAAREMAEAARIEVGADPVDLGIMVEIPSTVMMADEFAREVDFFSIGTNDLTQYALAIDRLHPTLAKMVDGLHPAILRLIDRTVQAASAHGKWVGVCGGVAGDPRGAVILAGLGVTELSMSIPSVAAVKARLRQIALERAQAVARKALSCTTAAEVRQLAL